MNNAYNTRENQGHYSSYFNERYDNYGDNNRCDSCGRLADPARYDDDDRIYTQYSLPHNFESPKHLMQGATKLCPLCFSYMAAGKLETKEIKIEKLRKENIYMKEQIKELESKTIIQEQKIHELEDEIYNMRYYAPNGPGYHEAKEHFETTIKKTQ